MQANTARLRYIPDLLNFHLEELEFLWGQRRLALHSRRYFLRDFLHLNERLEAHIQGLLAVPDVLPDLLLPQLFAAESRDSVFAAACPLLRLAKLELTEQMLKCFEQADALVLTGFRDAFSFAPMGQFVNGLKRILSEGEPLYAAHAATALANLRVLNSDHKALGNLLLHENPVIATAAWSASLLVDCLPSSEQQNRPYQAALSRSEAVVRDAVIKSAVWTRQTWIAPVLRQLVTQGDVMALQWLAIASCTDEDRLLIVAHLQAVKECQGRCDLLVRLGHPSALAMLRDWVVKGDPLLAAQAGEAFTLITACDVRGERIQTSVSETADEFEREFAPLIWTTNQDKLDDFLRQQGSKFKAANRWSRGLALTGVVSENIIAALDLQMRWDQLARHRLAGHLSTQPEPIFY
jgi:hypothetical protein